MPRKQRNAQRSAAKLPRLAYRICSTFPEVFLAEECWAEDVHRINMALRTSRTWGEFRRNMPRRAYSELLANYCDDPDDPHPRPKSDDAFDPNLHVPGYGDGHYPPWSKQHIEKVVPKSLLEKYGTQEWNMVNGAWWTIDAENWPDLKRELEERGYRLRERSDLTEFQ